MLSPGFIKRMENNKQEWSKVMTKTIILGVEQGTSKIINSENALHEQCNKHNEEYSNHLYIYSVCFL